MKKTMLFIAMFLCLLSFDSASLGQQESSGGIKEAFDLAVNKLMSISPCALKPKWSDTFQSGGFAAGPSEAYMTDSGPAPAEMFAPINLPHGATIKRVGGLCIDNDGSSAPYYILMRLERRDNSTNTVQTVAEVSTDGQSPSPNKTVYTSSVISYPTVDNKYSYSLKVRFGPDGSSGLIFYGFWILYE